MTFDAWFGEAQNSSREPSLRWGTPQAAIRPARAARVGAAGIAVEVRATVHEAASMPILRPLVGMDKSEFIAQAEAIGTFETSIQPDEDC